MESLLKNDFTTHYGLPVAVIPNLSIETDAAYFEIEDDINKETILHFTSGKGMAIYRNPNRYNVTINNYDKFVTSLPHLFQQGKKRCDLIVDSGNDEYFLLNELKDRNPLGNFRSKATLQLLVSLTLIMGVPTISTFASNFRIKQCCYFNKQSLAPSTITATTAFNRVSTLSNNGFKMSNLDIEAFGFELYEYSGTQAYIMQ